MLFLGACCSTNKPEIIEALITLYDERNLTKLDIAYISCIKISLSIIVPYVYVQCGNCDIISHIFDMTS